MAISFWWIRSLPGLPRNPASLTLSATHTNPALQKKFMRLLQSESYAHTIHSSTEPTRQQEDQMKIIATTKLTAAMAAQPKYIRKIAARVADAVGTYENSIDALKALTPKTKSIEAIRALPKSSKRGYKQVKHLDIVRELAGQIVKVRKARKERRSLPRRLAITARLENRRAQAVIRTAKALFRYGAAGGYDFQVRVGEPGYQVGMTKNWDVYKGSYKGWAAAVDNHVLTVPHNWLSQIKRIGRTGRAWAGNCLILSITPFIEADGRGIYEAVVAVQGRGYSVNVETRVLSTWPGGFVSEFKNLKQALADKPPAAPLLVHLPPDTDEFLADLVA